MMQWESTHELNAFRILDCDPGVTLFTEQPCEIEFQMEGFLHSHYPDILVEIGRRKEFWEVKASAQASRLDVLRRTAFLALNLPSCGYTYRMVLADDLAMQPRIENASTLLRFGRGRISVTEREFFRQLLKRGIKPTWGDVCAGVFGERGRAIVCRLILEGALLIDMSSALLPTTTIVRRPGVL